MHELPGTPKHPMSGVGLPHNPSSKMLPRVKGCGNPRLTQSSNLLPAALKTLSVSLTLMNLGSRSRLRLTGGNTPFRRSIEASTYQNKHKGSPPFKLPPQSFSSSASRIGSMERPRILHRGHEMPRAAKDYPTVFLRCDSWTQSFRHVTRKKLPLIWDYHGHFQTTGSLQIHELAVGSMSLRRFENSAGICEAIYPTVENT